MRTPLVAFVAALLGFIVGWASHVASPREKVRYVVQPPKTPLAVVESEPAFPSVPKPPLDDPQPIVGGSTPSSAPTPSSLIGDLPKLLPATSEIGPAAPLSPAKNLPIADLNADEALARRVVLGVGGEIVSSADAQDSNGKVGRSLVAEVSPGGLAKLRSALRASLGSRAVTSEGGTVSGSSTEVRKAEDELTALKKQLERAKDDFLPNAPALRNVEDSYREGERNLSEVRRTYARQRLNILLRPTLGG